MGVENFALTLQALARNATDNTALARGRRRAGKRGSISQPSSITLEPVPEQAASVDVSQELSADLTQTSIDAPMHRIAEAPGNPTSPPMSATADISSGLQAPFPGHVQPGEASDGCDDSSAPVEKMTGAQPADLTYVPSELITTDRGKRHQHNTDGHPVAESKETAHVEMATSPPPVECGFANGLGRKVQGTSTFGGQCWADCVCRRPAINLANGVCEGVKRSDSSNQHLLRRNDSSIVLHGESSGSLNGDDSKDVVTCLAWDDPSLPPQAHSLRKDAPRFATGSTNHAVACAASHTEAANGSESPVGVLREALQKYENGSTDITVEGLARLQLCAQEYATRAVPSPGARLKRRRRLPAAVARQVDKGCDANQSTVGGHGGGENTGPVASLIVDEARLSTTAHQLQQESSLKKSIRQGEAQKIMACPTILKAANNESIRFIVCLAITIRIICGKQCMQSS
eukprot:jgi/Ulvmu1/5937/UM026_0059.1